MNYNVDLFSSTEYKYLNDTNIDIINKTLGSLYKEHPEIIYINSSLKYAHALCSYLKLETNFYAKIRNQDNRTEKINILWTMLVNREGTIYDVSKPNIEPNVICMENEWYNVDQQSPLELAQLYGHPNVIISTLMDINSKLESDVKELNEYIRYLEKEQLKEKKTTDKLGTFSFVISLVVMGIGIYLKWYK